MSEQPNSTLHVPKAGGLLHKKVGGVPILYPIGGAVLILAVYAYKTNRVAPATGSATGIADPNQVAPSPTGGQLLDGGVLPTMPVGSVTGSPAPTTPTSSNPTITTNDEWIKAGVAFLITQGISGGVAQGGLQKYLDGSALSYVEGGYRDVVITKYGLPPTLLPIGTTDPKPVPTPPPPPPPPAKPTVGYFAANGSSTVYYFNGVNKWYVSQPEHAAKGRPHVTPVMPNDPMWSLYPTIPTPWRAPVVSAPPHPPVATHPKTTPNPSNPTHNRGGTAGGPFPFPGQIGMGSRGPNVIRVQQAVGVSRDGIYGPRTRSMVGAYQRNHGLAADGIVGPITWRKMYGPN